MTDTNILFIYLNKIIPNEHPIVYQYVMGGQRSKDSAITRCVGECKSAFNDAVSDMFIKKTVSQFLEFKRLEHSRGNIQITSIY